MKNTIENLFKTVSRVNSINSSLGLPKIKVKISIDFGFEEIIYETYEEFRAFLNAGQVKLRGLSIGIPTTQKNALLASEFTKDSSNPSRYTSDYRVGSNLYIATLTFYVEYQTPLKDKPLSKNNTSGYRGIGEHQGRYRVQISVNGKPKYIGSFDYIKDAINARNKAEAKQRGKIV